MARVKALFGMEHNGTKKKGDVFEVSDKIADELLRRGLVSRLKDAAPSGDVAAKPDADAVKQSAPTNKPAVKPAAKSVAKAVSKMAADKA